MDIKKEIQQNKILQQIDLNYIQKDIENCRLQELTDNIDIKNGGAPIDQAFSKMRATEKEKR